MLLFHFLRFIYGLGHISFFNLKKELKEIKKAMKQTTNKTVPKEESTYIGTAYKKPVIIPNNAKHVFICGTTGSGKTVALSNFIKSGNTYNYPMLLLDGKGDINQDSLLFITKNLCNNKKLYIIDMNNPKASNKYNPFKTAPADVMKDMLINMTDWTEPHYQINTERFIQRLCNLICKSDITPSFSSIVEYMQYSRFLELSKQLERENIITKEEHINNIELADNTKIIIQGTAARFSTILESNIGTIFDENGIDIYQAMKENAVIIFILNPLLYPVLSPLVGRLILIDSKQAISKLFTERQKRVFYIFDEINVYASNTFIDIVNKSRSANITCILATQSLSDLSIISEHFRDLIIENCNNYLVLRQNTSTNSELWANTIGTRKTMKATYQVRNDKGGVSSTDLGTLKRTREYLFHPDEIKALKTGEAYYVSKDNNMHLKVKINKPF